MHPVLANRGWYRVYLAAWLPVAGLLVALLVTAGGLPPLEALLLALPLLFLHAQICLSAWYLCRAHPLASTGVLRLGVAAGSAALLSGVLWVAAAAGWLALLSLTRLFAGAWGRLPAAAPILGVVGVLLYLLAIAGHYVVLAVEASRAAANRALELRALAREAELKALRSQVDPHFLFNSLNAVSAAIVRDPEGARRMVLELAGFLRQTLRLADRGAIPLSEELGLARSYLAIEKVRLGSRLRVVEEVEPGVEGLPVPPLLLQPLIENAIKHGVSRRLEGGELRIGAHRSGAGLRLTVDNDRDLETGGEAEPGFGLDNVRRRLEACHGREARLAIRSEADRFYVEVTLPESGGPGSEDDGTR